jgi:hypothetical protein
MSHAYDRIGSFIHVNPYAIAFCYIDPTAVTNLPPKGFIIKGGLKNVEKTITKYNHVPMLIFLTLWRHGISRQMSPRFYNFETDLCHNKAPWFKQSDLRKMGGRSFFRQSTLMFEGKAILSIRRVPRKWLPEYTKLREAYCFNGIASVWQRYEGNR